MSAYTKRAAGSTRRAHQIIAAALTAERREAILRLKFETPNELFIRKATR